jgi:hypothetical protein
MSAFDKIRSFAEARIDPFEAEVIAVKGITYSDCRELKTMFDQLTAERDRLLFEIGLAQEEAATFIGHCHDKTGQIKDLTVKRDRLREVLKNMLKSADCMWEDRDMGHDWPEACQQARAALQEDSDE